MVSSASEKGGNFCLPPRLCTKEETQRDIGAIKTGLDDSVTNVLYNLNQWISLGSGETRHGGGDLVVVNTAGLVGVRV